MFFCFLRHLTVMLFNLKIAKEGRVKISVVVGARWSTLSDSEAKFSFFFFFQFFWPFKARIWSSTDKQCLAAVNTPDFTRLCCLSPANKYGMFLFGFSSNTEMLSRLSIHWSTLPSVCCLRALSVCHCCRNISSCDTLWFLFYSDHSVWSALFFRLSVCQSGWMTALFQTVSNSDSCLDWLVLACLTVFYSFFEININCTGS